MRVVSVHIIQKPNRIDALRPHRTPTKVKLNTWAFTCNANKTKLPTVVVWNGPALIRITLIRIQCGWMLLRITMRIVGLVWTGLKYAWNVITLIIEWLFLWFLRVCRIFYKDLHKDLVSYLLRSKSFKFLFKKKVFKI